MDTLVVATDVTPAALGQINQRTLHCELTTRVMDAYTLEELGMPDGHAWWPTLRDNTPSPRTEMFWKRKDHLAARVGHWKWLSTPDHPDHLVDLNTDIAEKTNVAQQNPEALARIRSKFQAWLAEMRSAEPRGPFLDF